MKSFLYGVLGGVIGTALITVTPLQAALQKAQYSSVTLFNHSGKRAGLLGSQNEGQGALFLFSKDGKFVMQAGSYGTGQEAGQALFGLNDKSENLRLLARLYGQNDSPHLIFKDQNGRDRIVIGLESGTEVPYIRYTDMSGKMIDLLR